jgi:hypothetical protein
LEKLPVDTDGFSAGDTHIGFLKKGFLIASGFNI